MRPLSVSFEPPTEPDETVFARIGFGNQPLREERDFRVPLRCLDAAPPVEVWRYPGPSWTDREAGAHLIGCDDYLFLGIRLDSGAGDYRKTSREVYARILSLLGELRYPHIVKAWNYFPEMNRGEGDAERYKQFCLGRAEAFQQHAPELDSIPAATAIGSDAGEPFTIMLLAARQSVHAVENPRQVSAYRYPREYGPRSPLFSRAALLRGTRSACLFISGTAAIVGHRSRHVGDAAAQTEETVANLRTLLQAAGESGGLERPPSFGDRACLRVYVRDPALACPTRERIEPLLSDPDNLVVLEGAVCRRELQVEVDGVINVAFDAATISAPEASGAVAGRRWQV